MAKRRTIIVELHEEEQPLLVSGGEDFQTCVNDSLKNSHDVNKGLHIYKDILSDSDLIKTIFKTSEERDRLIQTLKSNVYSRAFNFLKK
ncbi:hypothetical protein ACQKP0_16030 [Heyndrickxia sp. NPDC080065]|uniref:hypothetical protein n=1 Tax=Heyndrickxia sp. NPDC080065 TaxID=3390568 RepID=UPI003D089D4F